MARRDERRVDIEWGSRKGTEARKQGGQVYAGRIATENRRGWRMRSREAEAEIREAEPEGTGDLERGELSFRYTEGASTEKRLSEEAEGKRQR